MVALKSAVVSTPRPAGSLKWAMLKLAGVAAPSVMVAGGVTTGVLICWSATVALAVTPLAAAAVPWLTVTVIGKEPSSAYVWLPRTTKVPAPKVMTPVLGATPSPQAMVALYSPSASAPAGSVKVATAWLDEPWPSFEVKDSGVALSTTDWSATVTLLVAVALAVPGALSAMVTVAVKEPSSAYAWLPLTVKLPPPAVVTVPVVAGELSPQSIVAVKSEGELVG
jgi:hypothetical protein